MTLKANVTAGEVGRNIDITCADDTGTAEDISSATAVYVLAKSPSGTVTQITGSKPGGAGVIRITTTSTTFTLDGDWELQPRAVGVGFDIRWPPVRFVVGKALTVT